MEEEGEDQPEGEAQPEDEEPVNTEEEVAPLTDVPVEEEEDEEEVVGSIIFQEDGPTTRKIQTELTVEPQLQKSPVAAAVGKSPLTPETLPFKPCGDMPLPPGADPWQWGFPEYCPKKMMRYAEAAKAAAEETEAHAAASETAIEEVSPGEEGELSEVAATEAGAEEEGDVQEEITEIVLSVLSTQDEEGAEEGEEVFVDAVSHEELEDGDKGEEEVGTEAIEVDIEVAMCLTENAEPASDEFQEKLVEEAAVEGETIEGETVEQETVEEEVVEEEVVEEEAVEEEPEVGVEEGAPTTQTDDVPAEEVDAPFQDQFTKEIDKMEPTSPYLWKIEQDIAAVRKKLTEMQERIAALDLPALSGAGRPDILAAQRAKCLCEVKKRAAERRQLFAAQPTSGMVTTPYPPSPSAQAAVTPNSTERYGYQAGKCPTQAACIAQYSTYGNALPDSTTASDSAAGVDIYIASRTGNSKAVTSINTANVLQYADQPVLKAFESPDVDVYVVTDKPPTSGCIKSSGPGSCGL